MADVNNYLDLNGLSYFSDKVKETYVDKKNYAFDEEIDELFKDFDGNVSTTEHYELKIQNNKIILTNKTSGEEFSLPIEFSEEFNKLDNKIEDSIPYNRVETLSNGSKITNNFIFETIGSPEFISKNDLSKYSEYNITDEGWYIFVKINAKNGKKIVSGFSVNGVAGYITPAIGDTSISAAIKFDVVAETQEVVVNWGDEIETFIFKATDLAIRNLDYRVTFYLYDIEDYTTWEYKLTGDEKFVANKKYYIKNGDEYTLSSTTQDETIPEDTYYEHSKVIFKDFTKNVSYYSEYIDCPIEIYLPEVDDENYGAWFEVQTQLDAARSITIIPSENTKVSGNGVANPKAGINIINFQFHKPTRTWLPTVTNWQVSNK